MRRNLVPHNTENDRIQSYLKDLSLKPLNMRGTSTRHRMMPTINFRAETKLDSHHFNRNKQDDVRSASELDKYTLDSSPNKSIAIKHSLDQNGLSPKTPESRKTQHKIRLPKLEFN